MVKALVVGAAGGIGQPLSLFLKSSPHIDELVIYDVLGIPGVLADLSHISTHVKITGVPTTPGFFDVDDVANAKFKPEIFGGIDIAVIPAGMPRKPGMTRDDLFIINAKIVKKLVDNIADHSPKAFILIISNPVNSLVPVAAEALKAKNVFNPQRLFGITTLDVVRSQTFVAELTGYKKPQDLSIPVIGGHSAHTILPILSQTKPAVNVPMKPIKNLFGQSQIENVGTKERVMGYTDVIERIQFAGDEVVGGKEGRGSATLSMAYAAFVFTEKVLQAAKGVKDIVECTYVYLPGIPGGDEITKETGCDFFSMPIELGPNGAEKAINILGSLSPDEKERLKICIDGYTKTTPKKYIQKDEWEEEKTEKLAGLKDNIATGVNFKDVPEEKSK